MVLRDVIQSILRVVICGTAVAGRSARLGAYYASPGNQFWPTLNRIGLTPTQLAPAEYPRVLDYGHRAHRRLQDKLRSDRGVGAGGFDVPRLTALLESHEHWRPVRAAGRFRYRLPVEREKARSVGVGRRPLARTRRSLWPPDCDSATGQCKATPRSGVRQPSEDRGEPSRGRRCPSSLRR